MPRVPPKKLPEQGKGHRTINGKALDVRTFSLEQGWNEKVTRGLIERRLVPFHRLGARIIFLRDEVDAWLKALDGCGPEEAIENMRART